MALSCLANVFFVTASLRCIESREVYPAFDPERPQKYRSTGMKLAESHSVNRLTRAQWMLVGSDSVLQADIAQGV